MKKMSQSDVLDVAKQFINLAQRVDDERAIDSIKVPLARYRLGLFRIVVVGEIKKGKSSFINALLAEPDLLPTASDVATSTVYKIMYGKERKMKVFFKPEDQEHPEIVREPLEINVDDLSEYGTENGNPDNEKMVDFIGIHSPNPLLKQGLVFIDTPGLGGLFEKHRDITWRYLPNSDAVFFIMDSLEAVASKAEMDALKKLRQFTPFIFFIQTKTDLVEKTKWEKWSDRNIEIISDQLNLPAEKVIYFPVSNKLKFAADRKHSLKHLERSGYGPLIHFIQNSLVERKEKQLAHLLLRRIVLEIADIQSRLQEQLKIASAESKENLDKLEMELITKKERYKEWKAGDLRQSMIHFQNEAIHLRQQFRTRLQEELDPSPFGVFVQYAMTKLKNSSPSLGNLAEKAEELHSESVDRLTQIYAEIQGEYYEKMCDLVKKIGEQIQEDILTIDSMHETESLKVDSEYGQIQVDDGSFFEKGRSFLYGGMAGSMMGTTAITLVAILIPPVGAVARIAALAGSLLGGKKGFSIFKQQKKKQAFNQIQSMISDAVRRTQMKAIGVFSNIANMYEQEVKKGISEVVVKKEEKISESLKSITEARQATREALKAKSDSIQEGILLAKTLEQNIVQHISPPKRR